MTKTKETAPSPKKLPSHGVFVVEVEGEKAFWTRIGCAWRHHDSDGFNVQIAAIPLTGRLVIRARKEG